jgi:transposase InsO family protein
MTRHIAKRKQYCYEEKKLVLSEFFSDKYADTSLRQFSKICGINYRTLCGWVRRIDGDFGRIEALRRVPRRQEISGLSQLPAPVRQLILDVKSRFPLWGPLKIKQYLFRSEQVLVPQSSIYRFLKELGLVKEREAAGAAKVHDRSFEYPYPLAAVQMDLMDVRLSSGSTIHLISLLDDYSRFVLGNRFTAVKTMEEVMDAFVEAVRTYGVMERLLTDRGGEFVSWQRFTRFEELLCGLDVEYIASGPDKKENQGKVERWHETVRAALRQRGPLDFSSEAQLWIRRLTDVYNYERPHQALGGLTPADRFFGVADELGAEMDRYRAGQRAGQRIYFTCRLGDRKIVVSGPRADKLSVLLDGVRLVDGTPSGERCGSLPVADGAAAPEDGADVEAGDAGTAAGTGIKKPLRLEEKTTLSSSMPGRVEKDETSR